MNKYEIKVTEKHTDIVHVEAETLEEAHRKAIEESECRLECVYDCVAFSTVKIEQPKERG